MCANILIATNEWFKFNILKKYTNCNLVMVCLEQNQDSMII